MLLLCLGLTACGGKPGDEGCSPSITPLGNTARHEHPRQPLSCGIFVQVSNYCVYNAEGQFKGVKQEVTGVCIGVSTP